MSYMIEAWSYGQIGQHYYADSEHSTEFTKNKEYGMKFASSARAYTVKAGLECTYPGMEFAVVEVM